MHENINDKINRNAGRLSLSPSNQNMFNATNKWNNIICELKKNLKLTNRLVRNTKYARKIRIYCCLGSEMITTLVPILERHKNASKMGSNDDTDRVKREKAAVFA
eukprot:Pgem_evm1s15273